MAISHRDKCDNFLTFRYDVLDSGGINKEFGRWMA